MSKMTFGSLFSGIGGIDLGLERAGMECKWQVEIEPFCNRVLAKHWPDVKRYGDVHEVGKHNLETVDLICGGFPCQPVSFAGRGKAQSDPRWLWPELARVVDELRPRYVFVENVPGLLHRGMGDVLVDLAASGYDVEWDCIPASALGAPHGRHRVLIVAYPALHGGNHEGKDAVTIFGNGPTISRVGYGGSPMGCIQHPLQEVAWNNGTWGDGGDSNQSPLVRVAHGVPNRVDRLRALGNAVVPQLAEWIGRRILHHG